MAVHGVQRRCGKVWRIDFAYNGGRQYRFAPPGSTKTEAKRLLAQWRGEVLAGTYVDPKAARRDGLAFDTFAARFLADYTGRRGAKSSYYRQ